MHKRVGSLLIVLGLIMLGASAMAYSGGGGSNISPTTTTTVTSTTTTTTSVPNKVGTTISASGGLAAPITVDGVPQGNAPVNVILTWGTHAIGCGQVTGFTPTSPTMSVAQDGTLTSITCVYTPQAAPTTTLTVLVQFCSLSTGTCYVQSGANVQLNTGATGLTGSTGQIAFTVQQNAAYTATWLNSGYGLVSASVNVGVSPTTLTLQATTRGFSIVPINDNPLGVGLSSAQLLAMMGLSFILLGGVVIAVGGKLEGEV